MTLFSHPVNPVNPVKVTRSEARLREQKNFLTDYEFDIEVTFFLREDDPEHAEEKDNILATLDCCAKAFTQTSTKQTTGDHLLSA